MMTIEKAAELVAKMPSGTEKCELFSHFYDILCPHKPNNLDGSWNDDHADWGEMFAVMCGFGIARNVTLG